MDSSLYFFIQQAFEHAGDAISIHKTDGTLLQVNKAFCKLTGIEKEENVMKLFIMNMSFPISVLLSELLKI